MTHFLIIRLIMVVPYLDNTTNTTNSNTPIIINIVILSFFPPSVTGAAYEIPSSTHNDTVG